MCTPPVDLACLLENQPKSFPILQYSKEDLSDASVQRSQTACLDKATACRNTKTQEIFQFEFTLLMTFCEHLHKKYIVCRDIPLRT